MLIICSMADVIHNHAGPKLWNVINGHFRLFHSSAGGAGGSVLISNLNLSSQFRQGVVGVIGKHLLNFRYRYQLSFLNPVKYLNSVGSSAKSKSDSFPKSYICSHCIRAYGTMPESVSNGKGTSFKRLPLKVIPTNYDLTFEPDWTCHRFQAVAVIDVEVKEATDLVILNANHFSVSEITYEGANEDKQEAEVFVLDLEQELLKINFAKPLAPGEGRLTIEYSGKVADNLKGFFRSKYQGPNGEDRFHYLTKFEPTFARSCYPCWDEPAIKTTYDITLVVPKHLVAVSNIPVKEDVPHPDNTDKKIVKFERSVKMSTYVMAFAIGEFDYVEKTTPDGILCRVYTPVGKKERGSFALEVVMKSLAFYKNYFGIPYPLPKMDLLGVAEFGSGAMENFGLVIFREQNLLLDEKLSSSTTKQLVAIVVAHETGWCLKLSIQMQNRPSSVLPIQSNQCHKTH